MEMVETDTGTLHVISQAVIIDDSTDKAWAEKHIQSNPHLMWILGKYVEGDNANGNRQFFASEELASYAQTLNHMPLDINHGFPYVGHFAGTELLYPTEGNPFVEALSAMYKTRFPDEAAEVEKAYKEGKLAYSMETDPETVTCGGDHGCGQTFKYEGRTDPSYCTHVNAPTTDMAKVFSKPQFVGGALIVPPIRPGWSGADITQVAAFEGDQAERTYNAVKEEFPHLDAKDWESMMMTIQTSYSAR